MIGNRVRVIRLLGMVTEGVLHKLDATGIVVQRQHGMPEQQGKVFIPMGQVVEIVDLGRAD